MQPRVDTTVNTNLDSTEQGNADEPSDQSASSILAVSERADCECETEEINYLGTDGINGYLQCQRCESVYVVPNTLIAERAKG